MNISSQESASNSSEDMEEVFVPITTFQPHFPNQSELNDLIRDLVLTKSGAELLSSRLMEWNLLDEDYRTFVYRKRHKEFEIYYDLCNDLCYCKDVTGLFTSLRLEHDPAQWLKMESQSSVAPQWKYPSLPLAHSVQKKEDYDNVKELLDKINYSKFKWDACCAFKILAFLLGFQGHTKYLYFLCL